MNYNTNTEITIDDIIKIFDIDISDKIETDIEKLKYRSDEFINLLNDKELSSNDKKICEEINKLDKEKGSNANSYYYLQRGKFLLKLLPNFQENCIAESVRIHLNKLCQSTNCKSPVPEGKKLSDEEEMELSKEREISFSQSFKLESNYCNLVFLHFYLSYKINPDNENVYFTIYNFLTISGSKVKYTTPKAPYLYLLKLYKTTKNKATMDFAIFWFNNSLHFETRFNSGLLTDKERVNIIFFLENKVLLSLQTNSPLRISIFKWLIHIYFKKGRFKTTIKYYEQYISFIKEINVSQQAFPNFFRSIYLPSINWSRDIIIDLNNHSWELEKERIKQYDGTFFMAAESYYYNCQYHKATIALKNDFNCFVRGNKKRNTNIFPPKMMFEQFLQSINRGEQNSKIQFLPSCKKLFSYSKDDDIDIIEFYDGLILKRSGMSIKELREFRSSVKGEEEGYRLTEGIRGLHGYILAIFCKLNITASVGNDYRDLIIKFRETIAKLVIIDRSIIIYNMKFICNYSENLTNKVFLHFLYDFIFYDIKSFNNKPTLFNSKIHYDHLSKLKKRLNQYVIKNSSDINIKYKILKEIATHSEQMYPSGSLIIYDNPYEENDFSNLKKSLCDNDRYILSEFCNYYEAKMHEIEFKKKLEAEKKIVEEREKTIQDLAHSIKNLIASAVIDPLELLKVEGYNKQTIVDALKGANLLRQMVNSLNLSHSGSHENFIYDLNHITSKDLSLYQIIEYGLKSAISNMFDGKYFNKYYSNYFNTNNYNEAKIEFNNSNTIKDFIEFSKKYMFEIEFELDLKAKQIFIGNTNGSCMKSIILFQEILLNAVKYVSLLEKEKRKISVKLTSKNNNYLLFEVSNTYSSASQEKDSQLGKSIILNFIKNLNPDIKDFTDIYKNINPNLFDLSFKIKLI